MINIRNQENYYYKKSMKTSNELYLNNGKLYVKSLSENKGPLNDNGVWEADI